MESNYNNTEHLTDGVNMPLVIWKDENLNPTEKMLLTDIYGLVKKYGKCFKGNQAFGELVLLSKDRVSRIISGLAKKGYVKVYLSKTDATNVDKRYLTLTPFFTKILLQGLIKTVDKGIGEKTNTPSYKQRGGIGENNEDKKSIKKSIKKSLISNNEQSSLPFDNYYLQVKKPLIKTAKTKEKKVAHPCYSMIVDYWLKEFKIGDSFSSTQGAKINNIIKKIETYLLAMKGNIEPENVFNFFKTLCENLKNLKYYKTADLSVIDSKFITIVEEINLNLNPNGTQQSNYKSTGQNLNEGYELLRQLRQKVG